MPLRNVIVNSNSSIKSYSKTGLRNHCLLRAVVFRISRIGQIFVDPPVDKHWFKSGMSNSNDREGHILCFTARKAVCGPQFENFHYIVQFFMTILF
jgi:hypothetical protein